MLYFAFFGLFHVADPCPCLCYVAFEVILFSHVTLPCALLEVSSWLNQSWGVIRHVLSVILSFQSLFEVALPFYPMIHFLAHNINLCLPGGWFTVYLLMECDIWILVFFFYLAYLVLPVVVLC